MVRVPCFHIDAFASTRFTGNPAAVVVFASYPPDAVLQAIAAEHNLSETAFLVQDGAKWHLRWFTPTVEVPLCGHATLASAWVILERIAPDRDDVVFITLRSGELRVCRTGSAYEMDFPSLPPVPVAPPPGLAAMLGVEPIEVLANATNYLAVLESAAVVRGLTPDLQAIARLDRSGLIVSARGDHEYDCVSRYFAPQKGIPEDPVTGGAHCALAPYWAARLGKPELRAFQASRRGGVIGCRVDGDRVALRGKCIVFSEGHLELD